MTPQRYAILSAFLTRKDHPSAERIFEELHDQFPTMAMSTVYNTLSLLLEMGEAAELAPIGEETRYDPNPADHCHAICLRCRRIDDIECDISASRENLDAAAAALGYQVVRRMCFVYGLCPLCAAEASEQTDDRE